MTVTISPVFTGTAANDGTGDKLQTAFIKVNNSLYNLAGNLNPLITPGLSTTAANTAYGVFANISVTNQVIGSMHFTGSDTIYINGSPVATSSSSFTGGNVAQQANFVAGTSSTSSSTGAVTVVGGVGVSGNVNAGGNLSIANGATIGGNLAVTINTDSSGVGVGSIVTAGGLSVARATNLGAALTVTGGTALNNTLLVSGATAITNATTSSGISSGALVVTGGVGIQGALHVNNASTFGNDLSITGNLVVSGNVTSGAQILTVSGNTVNLHTSASFVPLTFNDGGDIGTVYHYYTPAFGDNHAFLGWQNTTGNLIYLSNGAVATNGVYSGTAGSANFGGLFLTNTTPSTSATSGALQVAGGAGISGNLSLGGNILINGSNGTAGQFISSTGTGLSWVTLSASSINNGNSNVAVAPSGNITFAVAGSNVAVVTHTGILPSANVSANIGSPTAWFNTFYGVSTQAQYADLAENYLTDQEYEPGTVVVVGGDAEVTACTEHGQDSVIGAVSTNPAYLMNGAAGGQPIALKGRIPLKVFGPIVKGQRLSTSHEIGHAEYAKGDYSFAIALETDISLGSKVIEAIIL